MDENLESVLESAKSWPEADKAELVEVAREIRARRTGIYALSADERAAIAEGLAQARRGEFVSDAEMETIWARFGA